MSDDEATLQVGAAARPRHWVTPLEGALVAILLGLIVLTAIESHGHRSPEWVALAVTIFAILTAGLWSLTGFQASRRNPSARLAFRCFGFAGAFDVIAHAVLWGWFGVVLKDPVPVSSPFYLLPITAVTFTIVACFSLARARVRLRVAGALDAVLILCATAFVGWAFILESIYTHSQGSAATKVTALIPPAANILFIGILVPVGIRVKNNQRFIGLFMIAVVPILVSNIAFAYAAAHAPYYLGTPIDCGYSMTYLFAMIVMSKQKFTLDNSIRPATALPVAYVLVPYIPIFLAGITFLYLIISGKGLDTLLIVLATILVAAGFIRQLFVLSENISLSNSLTASEARYRHMALHDALTGLPNRNLFYDRAGQLREFAKRSSSHLAILAIDLDGFKLINDDYGHAAGDAVLTEVGTRLLRAIRGSDSAARLGGDEFAVVLIGGAEAARTVAQRILKELSAPYEIPHEEKKVRVGCSIGTAIGETDEEIDDLLSRSDHEMYENKLTHHAVG